MEIMCFATHVRIVRENNLRLHGSSHQPQHLRSPSPSCLRSSFLPQSLVVRGLWANGRSEADKRASIKRFHNSQGVQLKRNNMWLRTQVPKAIIVDWI